MTPLQCVVAVIVAAAVYFGFFGVLIGVELARRYATVPRPRRGRLRCIVDVEDPVAVYARRGVDEMLIAEADYRRLMADETARRVAAFVTDAGIGGPKARAIGLRLHRRPATTRRDVPAAAAYLVAAARRGPVVRPYAGPERP